MAIRCASKAIIIEDGAILLNRCKGEGGDTYYDLPGGGQKQYESMEQTVVREVKEETGYEVSVERFVALAEEINLNEEYRKLYPEYTHRVLHVFTAKLIGENRALPTEKDFGMEESFDCEDESKEKIISQKYTAEPEILERELKSCKAVTYQSSGHHLKCRTKERHPGRVKHTLPVVD